MKTPYRIVGTLIAIVLSATCTVVPASTNAASTRSLEAVSFNECGFRGAIWPLVQTTANIVAGTSQLDSASYLQQQTQWIKRESHVDDVFQSYYYGPAKRLESTLQDTWVAVADAIDAGHSGDQAGMQNYVSQARDKMNQSWSMLTAMCPLGRPARLLDSGSHSGDEYGNGVSPVPFEPPWLGPRSFLIRWSFNCSGHPLGFRIEVRRSQAGGYVTATGVYIGPFVQVAVNQSNTAGHGTTIIAGKGGKLYLIIRSRCPAQFHLYG
jgi:hypothetical protein